MHIITFLLSFLYHYFHCIDGQFVKDKEESFCQIETISVSDKQCNSQNEQ